jgi:hypothetical protein
LGVPRLFQRPQSSPALQRPSESQKFSVADRAALSPSRSRLLALYPAGLSAALVLTVYLDEGIPAYLSLRVVVLAALLGILMFGAAWCLVRDHRRAGLIAAALLVWLRFFHIPLIATACLSVALVVIVDRVLEEHTGRRSPRDLGLLHRVLPVFIAAILLVTCAQFAWRGLLIPQPEDAAPVVDGAERYPDIWIVMLDGYPRADVLTARYDVDNSEFVDGLSELGFTVATRNRSNYLSTNMTLPSMLNMTLLSELPPFRDATSALEAPAASRWAVLQDNRAFHVLREHGYETVAVGAGYSRVDLRSADRFIDTGNADVIELHLLAVAACAASSMRRRRPSQPARSAHAWSRTWRY